jgi:hypothetical protein
MHSNHNPDTDIPDLDLFCIGVVRSPQRRDRACIPQIACQWKEAFPQILRGFGIVKNPLDQFGLVEIGISVYDDLVRTEYRCRPCNLPDLCGLAAQVAGIDCE